MFNAVIYSPGCLGQPAQTRSHDARNEDENRKTCLASLTELLGLRWFRNSCSHRICSRRTNFKLSPPQGNRHIVQDLQRPWGRQAHSATRWATYSPGSVFKKPAGAIRKIVPTTFPGRKKRQSMKLADCGGTALVRPPAAFSELIVGIKTMPDGRRQVDPGGRPAR